MRKLASIQTITKLEPIEGADRIELATILGWKTVVKKGEFNIGDRVIYVEIDSILPDKPEFSFLQNRHIKTVKLRGQISQGIIFPLSILLQNKQYELGQDVTEELEITKYEPREIGDNGSPFPYFITKTDETRIQSLTKIIVENQGRQMYVTEKLDGSSLTVYYKNGKIGVCSHNKELPETETMFWGTVKKEKLNEKLYNYCHKFKRNLAIQGELVGPKIQGNKLELKEQQIFAFSIYDIDKLAYAQEEDFITFCHTNDIQTVPILDVVKITDMASMIELAKGNSALNKNKKREGLVLRNLDGSRLSFKIINNDYLLKYKE